MKRVLLMAVVGVNAVLSGCAASALLREPSLSGDVSARYGYAVEDHTTAVTRLEGNLRARSGDIGGGPCGAEFGGRFRGDREIEPSEYHTAEVRDLAVTCRAEDWLVSVGRQMVVWGKVDGFRVLDLVHPFDYREFLLDDPNAARKPLAMARVERRTPGNGFLQVLVSPEHREDGLPSIGGRFAAISPAAILALRSVAPIPDAPDWREPGDWEYGVKWEQNAQDIGYTLNVLTKLSTSRTYAAAADATVLASFHRQQLFGGSVDFGWRRFIIRGEAVYSPDVFQPSLNRSPVNPLPVEYAPYKQLSTALGVERQVGEWLVGGQLLSDQYLGAHVPPRIDLTGSQRWRALGTVLVTRSLLQDRTRLRVFAVRDVTDRGTWVTASVSHAVRSAVEVSFGADLLAGRPTSVLGRIADRDRMYVQLKLSK